jgi:hypothetical protein
MIGDSITAFLVIRRRDVASDGSPLPSSPQGRGAGGSRCHPAMHWQSRKFTQFSFVFYREPAVRTSAAGGHHVREMTGNGSGSAVMSPT